MSKCENCGEFVSAGFTHRNPVTDRYPCKKPNWEKRAKAAERQLAARDRELQQAAAENAAMRESAHWFALQFVQECGDDDCTNFATYERNDYPAHACDQHIEAMQAEARKVRSKGGHALDYKEASEADAIRQVRTAIATPSPSAAQILAALDAARLAYAVPNQTATGADLEALTDLGRKLAALASRDDDGGNK